VKGKKKILKCKKKNNLIEEIGNVCILSLNIERFSKQMSTLNELTNSSINPLKICLFKIKYAEHNL